jgi:hypothetical protein
MVLVAVVAAIVIAYGLAHLALIEVGREVVTLRKWSAGGTISNARLWIVDDGGRYAWLHHGYADSDWIRRLAIDPVVTIERGGMERQYRARPDLESHQRVHELLREKYGIADRWVRLVTGGTERCRAVPVRLEPVDAVER